MNARIQKRLFRDINEQRAERSGETMSKPSEREREQYLGNTKKKNDKGGMTAPCRSGRSVMQNKQQGQRKAVCLVKFL